MHKIVPVLALACAGSGSACAHAEPDEPAPAAAAVVETDFVGRYDGSSFETAMGLEIAGDGTFRWGLSVGALDMRSSGTWQRDGYEILFRTEPTPTPPEFRFLGFGSGEGGRLVEVVRPDGQRFTYADAVVECADGSVEYQQVIDDTSYYQGVEEQPGCGDPVAVTVMQSNYNVTSPRFDIVELGWTPGRTVRFEFVPNDIGVLDLTGMRGTLADGVLTVDGPLGVEKFRKLGPRPDPDPQP